MNFDPQNPFAIAGQSSGNATPAPSPFQAAPAKAAPVSVDNPFQVAEAVKGSATAPFPFAGVGSDTPFGLVDAVAGQPAKLPERRFPEPAQNGSYQPTNIQSPFERAGAGHESPFEAVVGGPTEGFLAESPQNYHRPPVYQAPAAPVQDPAPAPGPFDPVESQRVPQSYHPAEPQQAAPVQPAPAQENRPKNGYNGNENGAALFDAPAPTASSFTPVNSPSAGQNGNGNGFAPVEQQKEVSVAPISPDPATPVLREVVSPPSSANLAPVVPTQAPRANAPAPQAQSSVAHGGTPQLVLRAIFGVNHELTAHEMLQRARTLPGVRNLRVVGSDEARAMHVLRVSVSRLGFGEEHSIGLSSPDGDIDIIEEEGTTLAILHEDGGYAAGVRETLIIVTRELARLG